MKEKHSHDALNKKLEGLPVPDEEQSWQKMKALLDKDERKKRILPPFFLNCAGWALLILLTAGSILIFRPFSKDDSVSKIDSVDKKNIQTGETSQTPQRKKSSGKEISFDSEITPDTARDNTISSVPLKSKDYQNSEKAKDNNLVKKLTNGEGNKRTASKPPILTRLKKTEASRLQPVSDNPTTETLKQSNQHSTSENNGVVKKDSVYSSISETFTQGVRDSTSENDMVTKKDSAQVNDSTTLAKTDKDSLVTEKKVATEKKKTKNFYLAAGLSLHQQIPQQGQSLNSYSVNGRESLLADYVPAIYLRLYKEKKWFLQAGFRYAAPQAVKEFTYRNTTTRDNVRRTTTNAILTLKKTFYHQLPFSFNYSPVPNFSFGAGGMYSRFETAVSELELRVRSNQTGVETVRKQIMKTSSDTDPVFTSSQWHYLLQAEYSWKKLGVGFRYTGGLQPFIRYTELGLAKEEKSKSLQLFLRYDFLKRQLKSAQ